MNLKTHLGIAQAEFSDGELVAKSISGNRDAFGQIVARYQGLVCSVAYSSTGDLGRSEDLAQETFLAAWQRLPSLRETGKLRAWLCGIARNLALGAQRRSGRDLAQQAQPLEEAQEASSGELLPVDKLISREEEATLWRALENLPPAYREAMVLYYRKGESVAATAEALEISIDAARQRLCRGRALLAEQIEAGIRSVLQRSAPGAAFTLAVLASLPALSGSASAATIGATAAKGSALAKSAAFVGVFGAIIGPMAGLFGGWLGVKASLLNAQSERERRYILRNTKIVVGFAAASLMLLAGFYTLMGRIWRANPILCGSLFAGFWVAYTAALLVLIFRFNRTQARIRREEAALHPERPAKPRVVFTRVEYRSPWRLLGLPLIHLSTGSGLDGKSGKAVGWIAIGDVAYGILFALGGLSFGGISIGGVSVGVIAGGGAGLGLLTIGGLAIGLYAAGGAAIGMVACGGAAVAWHFAEGGMAVAHDFAVGGAAHAAHANDALAGATGEDLPMVRVVLRAILYRSSSVWFQAICWSPFLLLLWQSKRIWRGIREAEKSGPR